MSSVKRTLVLGANGLLGSALLSALKAEGIPASGTTRRRGKSAKTLLPLDLSSPASIERFPWARFDTVIDCTGSIDYGNDSQAAANNLQANVVTPLRIIGALRSGQRYFYCSTHAVLVPEGEHNTYSRSKKIAEEFLRQTQGGPQVVVLRLPALFSNGRTQGLLATIKRHFAEEEPLALDVTTRCWHVMYLPRAVGAVMRAVSRTHRPGAVITIGYRCPTDLPAILAAAARAFGYGIDTRQSRFMSDGYVPDVDSRSGVAARAFTQDLLSFFSAP